jgi:uncharacterized membrane protein YfcA
LRVATGLALGGLPAVLVAAFLVKSMPVEAMRWLVTLVVLYAAMVMVRATVLGRRDEISGATLAGAGRRSLTVAGSARISQLLGQMELVTLTHE